jgi:N-acetylglucosaminyl-diphospho-decaprenol L-rhamnosyltransferase
VALVDAVVVSFRSAGTIRACVQPLAAADWVNVIVVDNASDDGSLETVDDLGIVMVPLERNLGFAYGCNRGWERGSAPYVLFLNPDARLEPADLRRLVEVLDHDRSAGLVAPRILDADGSLDHSLRRFARLRSTYAQALFLHRILPRAGWTDQVVRDPSAYGTRHSAEWVSGACMLVRRQALEEIGGWDEGFFLYGEDQDLCRRLWLGGHAVSFEPAAQAVHVGGASGSRAGLLPVLAESRIRYAKKHRSRVAASAERVGVGVGALTHALLTTKSRDWRAGYVRALRVAAFSRDGSSPSARGSLSH